MIVRLSAKTDKTRNCLKRERKRSRFCFLPRVTRGNAIKPCTGSKRTHQPARAEKVTHPSARGKEVTHPRESGRATRVKSRASGRYVPAPKRGRYVKQLTGQEKRPRRSGAGVTFAFQATLILFKSKIFLLAGALVSVETDKRLFMTVEERLTVTESVGNVRERNGIGY